MFQKIKLSTVLLFSLLCAVGFAIPMTYFIYSANYQDTWWLFVGNFLFMIGIIIYMLLFTSRKNENPNTNLLLTAGHIVTVGGVILSCIIAFIVLMMFPTGIVSAGPAEQVMENTPAHADDGKTDGLVLFVYLTAIIGNVSAGSAVAIFMAYTTKKNQTKEKVISQVKVDTNLRS
ncbi:hypothetical protein [Aridibaculum aurantiacum]|uniref:hypothetical protein n=1 Tax=Aridibaculum aurantiacum TaxID=2810307 RepID=UPI001A95F355|nr:hypothetical protein [Aridibaculum aurantiacum]